MDLSTFGAVMKYSMEALDQAAHFHETISSLAKEPVLKAAIESLLEETKRHKSLVEQVRRENVTEMILEPFSGFSDTDCPSEKVFREDATARDLLAAAISIETVQMEFFAAVSARIPYPEVSRAFRKISQRKEFTVEMLRSLKI